MFKPLDIDTLLKAVPYMPKSKEYGYQFVPKLDPPLPISSALKTDMDWNSLPRSTNIAIMIRGRTIPLSEVLNQQYTMSLPSHPILRTQVTAKINKMKSRFHVKKKIAVPMRDEFILPPQAPSEPKRSPKTTFKSGPFVAKSRDSIKRLLLTLKKYRVMWYKGVLYNPSNVESMFNLMQIGEYDLRSIFDWKGKSPQEKNIAYVRWLRRDPYRITMAHIASIAGEYPCLSHAYKLYRFRPIDPNFFMHPQGWQHFAVRALAGAAGATYTMLTGDFITGGLVTASALYGADMSVNVAQKFYVEADKRNSNPNFKWTPTGIINYVKDAVWSALRDNVTTGLIFPALKKGFKWFVIIYFSFKLIRYILPRKTKEMLCDIFCGVFPFLNPAMFKRMFDCYFDGPTMPVALATATPQDHFVEQMSVDNTVYRLVPQAKETDTEGISMSAVAEFCSTFFKPEKKVTFSWIVETLPKFHRLGEAIKWFVTHAKRLYAYIYSQITGDPIPTTPLETEILDLQERFLKMEYASTQEGGWGGWYRKNQDNVTQAMLFQSSIRSLGEALLVTNSVNPLIRSVMEKLRANGIKMLQEQARFDKTAEPRPVPTWINFYGAPGLGKSSTVTVLMANLKRRIHEKLPSDTRYALPFSHSDVFTINQAETYWDGYNNQTFLLIDEALQSKDPQLIANLTLNLMTFVSPTPMNVPIADLNNKGARHLNAEFLITTRNQAIPQDLKINNEEALLERQALTLEITRHHCECPKDKSCPFKIDEMFSLEFWQQEIISKKESSRVQIYIDNVKRTRLTLPEVVEIAADLNVNNKKVSQKPIPILPNAEFTNLTFAHPRYKVQIGELQPSIKNSLADRNFKPLVYQARHTSVRLVFVPFRDSILQQQIALSWYPTRHSPPHEALHSIYYLYIANLKDMCEEDRFNYWRSVKMSLDDIKENCEPELARLISEVFDLDVWTVLKHGDFPLYDSELWHNFKLTLPPNALYDEQDFDDDSGEMYEEEERMHDTEVQTEIDEKLTRSVETETSESHAPPVYAPSPDTEQELLRYYICQFHPGKLNQVNLEMVTRFIPLVRCKIFELSEVVRNRLITEWKRNPTCHMIQFDCYKFFFDVNDSIANFEDSKDTRYHLDHPVYTAFDTFMTGDYKKPWYQDVLRMKKSQYVQFREKHPEFKHYTDSELKRYHSWYLFGTIAASITVLLGALTVLIGIGAAIHYAVCAFFEADPDLEPQSGTFSGNVATKKTTIIRPKPGKTVVISRMVPQGAVADCTGIESVLRHNIHQVHFGTLQGYVVGVGHQVVLTNRHNVENMTDDDDIVFGADSLGSLTAFRYGDCVRLDGKNPNIVFIGLPGCQFFRNISNFFRDTDITNSAPIHRMMLTKQVKDNRLMIERQKFTSHNWERTTEPILDCDILIWNMPNEKGLCGLPYYVTNVRTGEHIVGIHGAGDGAEQSAATAVYREDVEWAIQAYSTRSSSPYADVTPRVPEVLEESIPATPGTRPLGKMPIGSYMSVQSKLIKTEMHPDNVLSDALGTISMEHIPTRSPAILRPHDGISPMSIVNAKYITIGDRVNVSGPIDPQWMATVPFHLLLPKGFNPKVASRLITLTESIEGGDFIPALELDKSSGYPHVLYNKTRSDVLYGKDGKLSQEFLSECIRVEKLLETAIYPMVVVDALKDELILDEDIAKGKVRRFCISELVHTVLSRRYGFWFLQEMYKRPYETPIAVGLNAHSVLEWSLLFQRLTKNNTQVLAGDFKGHEYTIPPDFVEPFTKLFDYAAPMVEPYATRRRNLLRSCFNVYHVSMSRCYQVSKGNASGNPWTPVYASFATYCVYYISWLAQGRSLEDWRTNVELSLYGDDSVVSVKNAPEYNMKWVSEVAESIGMFYTSFDKKADFEATASIYDVEFLKRSFVQRDGVVYAPLRWSSIMESPMWIDRTSINPKMDMSQMWNSVLLELRHYPRELYEKYYNLARRWSARVGATVVFPNWETAHAQHLYLEA
jgi:hypothetical protein